MNALLLLLIILGACHATTVTYSGYVTDVLCHDKCVVADQPGGSCTDCALDGSNVIQAPSGHEVHCIRDVQACIDTGYFLAQNIGTAASPNYAVRYKLDSAGNDMVLTVIKNTATHSGLQVSVTGTDDNDGYLRNPTSIVECSGGSATCDGVCTGTCVWTGTSTGRQGPVSHDLVLLHGSLLLIAWALLAPLGFIIKRNPNTLFDLSGKVCGYPLAFLLHGIMMSTAVCFTVTGVLIALIGFDQRALFGHYPIGVVVFIVVAIQPFPALFCRPDHGQPKRKYFNWVHWLGGGLALTLGAINVILGTMNYRTLWNNCIAPTFIGCAAASIGFVAVLGIVCEVLRRRQEAAAAPAPITHESELEEVGAVKDGDKVAEPQGKTDEEKVAPPT